MRIFKFGGGSVKDAYGVKQLSHILKLYPEEKLVVVVSAIGKTTNLLESILKSGYDSQTNTDHLLSDLEERHYGIVRELSMENTSLISTLQIIYRDLRNALSSVGQKEYDYHYDQIVSFGEILSTTIISSYLNQTGISNLWMDARKLIRTDHSHREAKVDWEISTTSIREQIEPYLLEKKQNLIITQGFIGGTIDNATTTLGREGSDYSAAIFGYALDAREITIWKDVDGLFNADPKVFPAAVKLDEIPYEEAIELSYYGATVIHPKTLQPLQNKQIPLYVKSFFHPEREGTKISAYSSNLPIPSYIFKNNQLLLSIFPKDFSFITVENLSEIFAILSRYKIQINLMQNSALSFSICVDNHPHKIEQALQELKVNYHTKYNNEVELATIRHYDDDSIRIVLGEKDVLVEQKNRTTIQMVLKAE